MASTPTAFQEILTRYEPVIGLEVHAQLLTRTKLFCSCVNRFGDPPNTNVCPVCLGLPGALPVLSREAVTLAMRAALATHCTVQEESIWARKNYFYPDLPKGYQISQFEKPLALEGWIEIPGEGGEARRIRLQRIHMEEDAGKLLHEGFPWSGERSGVDFNRGGVPLIEMVTHPDLHSPEDAHQCLGLQHGGGLAALRRQRVGPAPGRRGPRHPRRDQEPQLLPPRGQSPRARDRPAGGGDRGRG
jgi:aspartyl-tRNA(Asn)/glutamyl-tRNA(Gln) amidotransferase subunit B